MRVHVRKSLLTLLAGSLIAIVAPVAAQAAEAPGIEKLVAVNCSETHKECGQVTKTVETAFGPQTFSEPKEPTEGEAKAEGYTQAGGHIPYGITDFKVATVGALPAQAPTSVVTHIRTDVAPGLATNPTAVAQCSMTEFGEPGSGRELPKSGFFIESACKEETKLGINNVTVYAGAAGDLALTGTVYNLVQPTGRASEFGVALKLPKPFTEAVLFEKLKGSNPAVEKGQYYAHTLIEGDVEWGKEEKGTNAGDYHDYFEIEVSPALPLISSRLTFEGRNGGNFLTNATSCPGNNTTTLRLTDAEKTTVSRPYTTPVGLENCGLVPFEPSFSLSPETTASDAPNGFSTQVGVAQHSGATELNGSQLKTAVIKLPEGMTLDPSAAAGLTACTESQARIHSSTAGTACPSSSELGTVKLEVPTLPAGSLTGKMYLGGPSEGAIKGPPYILYVDAETARYGVSVRLQGEVVPNEVTGQLDNDVQGKPRTAVYEHHAAVQGGRAGADRKPALVRNCYDGKRLLSLHADIE